MEIMTLAYFSPDFFFSSIFFFFYNSDPVSVCILLYGIILIQILIKYNVKNLITACTRLHDSDPQNWKISLPSPRSVASLPRAWSLRSLAFVLKILSVFFLKSSPPPPLWKTCLRHWLKFFVHRWSVLCSYVNYNANVKTKVFHVTI